MKLLKEYKKILHTIALALICSSQTSAMATSRMGWAVVTELNGRPCFSIQENDETRGGLPLDGIVVEETLSAVAGKYPAEVWHFTTTDLSPKTILLPTACVRYGDAPPNTTQRTLKQLELFKIYSVSVIARPENSNIIAYRAEFCIQSDNHGKITVQQISNGERGGKQRYEVCAQAKQQVIP